MKEKAVMERVTLMEKKRMVENRVMKGTMMVEKTAMERLTGIEKERKIKMSR